MKYAIVEKKMTSNKEMAINPIITPNMTRLLDELKTQLTLVVEYELKSSELLVKIYEQGKTDGLPNNQIRELVVTILRQVKHLGDRQIRRLLPEELKRKYNLSHIQDEEEKFNSDIMSELPTTFSATFAGLNVNINPEYEKIHSSESKKIYDDEYKHVKHQIQSIGGQTIIINEYGTIIDGHKTFRIYNELGITPRYEVKEFEDGYAEQEFIILKHLHHGLIEFRKYELWIKLEDLTKKAILERVPRYVEDYLSMGIWIKNALVAVETRLIRKDILCFLCEIDGNEDPFIEKSKPIVIPCKVNGKETTTKIDGFSEHILKHIELNGWSKYIPHLIKDPKTHQWKLKEEPEIEVNEKVLSCPSTTQNQIADPCCELGIYKNV